jgi:two-component system, NarL family, nitrate/nitrite response regulator NarL
MGPKDSQAVSAPAVDVIIADGHPLYRAALSELITASDRLMLLAACEDGVQALSSIRAHVPDVAVLDIRMPGLEGHRVAERVESEGIATRVLFLSDDHQGELVHEALLAGGSGYLGKTATGEEIERAIVEVSEGHEVLSAEVGGDLARALRVGGHDTVGLSARELEVLRLIATGATARSIAEQLHLATPTIKTHLQNVYLKLGVSSRGSAVAEAMRKGLVD